MVSFGPYQLVRRLSVGGMAEIFLAVLSDDASRTPLVVKRVLPRLDSRADVAQMFIDEGRLCSQLAHPNLVQVHEAGRIDGQLFIAMEYVDGLSLSEVLTRQPARRMPFGLACWIVAEACAGLGYAHTRSDPRGNPLGIVHRDISPDNILIRNDGQVKLADFGIAKASVQMARTRPGQIKGKLAYMSPEQLRRQSVDHRSDLFSAGLVLYEATVGRRAFSPGNDVDLLRCLVRGDFRPPERELTGYPPTLAAIVKHAIQADPGLRYQSAEEMRQALLLEVPAGADPPFELGGLLQRLRQDAGEVLDEPVTASLDFSEGASTGPGDRGWASEPGASLDDMDTLVSPPPAGFLEALQAAADSPAPAPQPVELYSPDAVTSDCPGSESAESRRRRRGE